MTIAVCYVSPEGIVLGADSTASLPVPTGGMHYFNHNQKLFELGDGATFGIVTWGLGSFFGARSYRTLFANLADDLRNNPPADMAGVAARATDSLWSAYQNPDLLPAIQLCQKLGAKGPHVPANPTAAGTRTATEEQQFRLIASVLVAGFCVAGYAPDRKPGAFEIIFDPLSGKPTPIAIPMGEYGFWGAPNIIKRLIFGADDELKNRILTSGHWNGTSADLDAIIDQQKLKHPILPIRDAVDFVHACIYSTIKAMKFSYMSQVCGGPIELAVITTDRKFRWVRHKEWDAAIAEGAI